MPILRFTPISRWFQIRVSAAQFLGLIYTKGFRGLASSENLIVSLRQTVSQTDGGTEDDLQAENVHRNIEIENRNNSAFMIVDFGGQK
jgi:hypothetical protein